MELSCKVIRNAGSLSAPWWCTDQEKRNKIEFIKYLLLLRDVITCRKKDVGEKRLEGEMKK